MTKKQLTFFNSEANNPQFTMEETEAQGDSINSLIIHPA
jgi:hypothetical protein